MFGTSSPARLLLHIVNMVQAHVYGEFMGSLYHISHSWVNLLCARNKTIKSSARYHMVNCYCMTLYGSQHWDIDSTLDVQHNVSLQGRFSIWLMVVFKIIAINLSK